MAIFLSKTLRSDGSETIRWINSGLMARFAGLGAVLLVNAATMHLRRHQSVVRCDPEPQQPAGGAQTSKQPHAGCGHLSRSITKVEARTGSTGASAGASIIIFAAAISLRDLV